jgi:uncharacterized protein YsxB (DUF464 family)
MVKFEFKQTNQEAPPHYRPPAPVVGGSAQPDPSVGGTSRAGQVVGLPPTCHATSSRAGGSTRCSGGSAIVAGSIAAVGTSLSHHHYLQMVVHYFNLLLDALEFLNYSTTLDHHHITSSTSLSIL